MFEQVERAQSAPNGAEAGSAQADDSRSPVSITAMGSGAWIEAPTLTLDRGCLVAGRYQIEDAVGSGGSGRVFRAYDRATGTLIALKVLKPEMAREPKWLERLHREVRVARQIAHAHVVRIWDVGESDGLRFITMELAVGGTLRRSPGKRSWDARVADARAVLSGLEALHQAGIVHRDIKPENFLRMEDGRLVLSDFGLATDSAGVGTLMVGTPFYMAPELVMGETSSARSDVWAMGVVLHELFFGLRPEWEWRDYRRVMRSPLTSDSTRAERRVFELCRAATTEIPEERPENGAALAQLLERALAGKRPPSTGSLRSHRRRAGVLWGTTTLLGLGALILIGRDFGLRMPQADASSSAAAAKTIDVGGADRRTLPAAREVLDLEGELHCVSALPGEKSLLVVWGTSRTAEEVDLTTGARRPTTLPAETYRLGCPEISMRTGAVLFEAEGDGNLGRIIKVIEKPGAAAHTLTAGTGPLWIPHSDDFVFNIDEGHAAVYSFAQRNFALAISTDPSEGRTLYLKAVSPDGKFLATKHLGGLSGVTVLVRSLPSLEVAGQVAVGPRLNGLRFSADNGLLRFATSHEGKNELCDVDWRTGKITQCLSTAVSGSLKRDVSTALGLVGVGDTSKYQIWLAKKDALERPLVTDGANFFPSRDEQGNVLFVSVDGSGARIIRSWDPASETTKALTNGPHDLWPNFAPPGNGWIYVKVDSNTVMHCPRLHSADGCVALATLPHQVFRPALSPDMRHLAYLGVFGSSLRASLYDLGSQQLSDLGPALNDEAPRFSSTDHVWFLTESNHKRSWQEFSLGAKKSTGRAEFVEGDPGQTFTQCGRFPFPSQSSAEWACNRSDLHAHLTMLAPPTWH